MSETPEWLADLLAQHAFTERLFEHLNNALEDHIRCRCGEKLGLAGYPQRPHYVHVADVVWAEVQRRITEAQANTDDYGPYFDAAYLLERLGGFPDEIAQHA